MNHRSLREGVVALEEEIGRLDDLRDQIDETATSDVPALVAQVEERIRCTLQVAVTSLERDTSILDTYLRMRG